MNINIFLTFVIINFATTFSKDATIILFDVGKNTKVVDEQTSQTFYTQAKRCAEAIVMRKVMYNKFPAFFVFLNHSFVIL